MCMSIIASSFDAVHEVSATGIHASWEPLAEYRRAVGIELFIACHLAEGKCDQVHMCE